MDGGYHIHLVSDSTGETTYNLARACLVQFENLHVQTHTHAQIRDKDKLATVLLHIREAGDVVLYTLVDPALNRQLAAECAKLSIPCIDILGGVLSHLEKFFGQNTQRQPGRQHIMDAGYFDRIEAMHYTMENDDGQRLDRIEEANIVLIGVSRTSKTPTAIYLANHRGLKVANIPFVSGSDFPMKKLKTNRIFVTGLTTSADRLLNIRKQRLRLMGEKTLTDYVTLEKIMDELRSAKQLCNQMSWPVIDVTKRSIEETASEIISLYDEWIESTVEYRPGSTQ
tara:strand:+ start:371 stop:1219 length:849 start_codon:yes stop_codon:yes gene_type:complete